MLQINFFFKWSQPILSGFLPYNNQFLGSEFIEHPWDITDKVRRWNLDWHVVALSSLSWSATVFGCGVQVKVTST